MCLALARRNVEIKSFSVFLMLTPEFFPKSETPKNFL